MGRSELPSAKQSLLRRGTTACLGRGIRKAQRKSLRRRRRAIGIGKSALRTFSQVLALLRVDDRLPFFNPVLGRVCCRLSGDLGDSVQFADHPGVEARRFGSNLLRILTSQLAPGETRTEPIFGILDLQVRSSPYGDSELAFHVRERATNSTILISLYMEASQTLYPPRQSRTYRQAGRNRRGRGHGRSR